ncbi:MAG TPA: GvpL/GvpF family gas vesicle protein [Nocardioidaceae bacterium]|nr:GvpL/GvpF family gas vesicle protein [Nocardioidaceae bacterium]
MSAADTVLHAYGVVFPNSEFALPETGIDDAPVSLEPDDGVAVLVSPLSVDRFGPDQWERHSDDPRWLGNVAQQHHQVIQQVMDQVDVLPLRLPGLHRDRQSLRNALTSQSATLVEALSRVRGRMELGVKVYWVDKAPSTEEAKPAQSGRDYLMKRSAQSKERDESRQRRHDAVVAIHERLADAAVDAVTNPPQDPVLSGRKEPMLLNAAYLVDRDQHESFLARVDQLRDEYSQLGLSTESSGPWPPYNFADVTVPDRGGTGT